MEKVKLHLFSGYSPQRMILKENAVPSQFSWTQPDFESSKKRKARVEERNAKRLKVEEEKTQAAAELESLESFLCDPSDLCADIVVEHDGPTEIETQTHRTETCEVFAQTDESEMRKMRMSNELISREDFRKDPKGLLFYTGFSSVDTVYNILFSLGPGVHHLNFWNNVKPSLPVHDQLFLVLTKLRTYRTNYELHSMFRASESDIYAILITWLHFMSLQWREIYL
jgi:hypothetical protein